MKISGFGSVGSTSSSKRTGGTSSTASFADLLAAAEAGDVAHTAPTSDIAATAALNNLLALQEISEEDIQRKKLAQHGNNMLDVLEKLRTRLLVGTLSPQLLVDLGRQIAIQKQMVTDPKLNALIEDIELRAAVELAKLERAMQERNAGSVV